MKLVVGPVLPFIDLFIGTDVNWDTTVFLCIGVAESRLSPMACFRLSWTFLSHLSIEFLFLVHLPPRELKIKLASFPGPSLARGSDLFLFLYSVPSC